VTATSYWAADREAQTADLDRLNVIHIAGTKGKGSTAAFVSSIFNRYRSSLPGTSNHKVGLYTSPHLRFVRERIQINGLPLSEEKFAKYFFETWDKFGGGTKPVYFRFLTLMAFHTFISEKVVVAIVECGMGGTYDSTNIIPSPVVTAITSLGIDHVGMLGSTISEIARHKAGIMKQSAKCYTPVSNQEKPGAETVLEEVAQSVGTELKWVTTLPDFADNRTRLGLQGEFQKENASVAMTIVEEWFAKKEPEVEDDAKFRSIVLDGIASARWPGRCDTRHEGNITWCIDGGHTLESIQLAGQWFASEIKHITTQTSATLVKIYLVFNQQTRERNASALARALYDTLTPLLPQAIGTALFTPNTTFSPTSARKRTAPDLISVGTNPDEVDKLIVQNELAATWKQLDADARVEVKTSIEETIGVVRDDVVEEGVQKVVLVTGSLHLVGGVLEILEG
jgi:folylpolyglutamate synthase